MRSKKIRSTIIKRLGNEKPSIWIGKKGVTPALIKEVDKQLDKKEVLKIKVLKTGLEQTTMEDLVTLLVEETKSELVESRGHILILYRKNNNE